jgi:hypothetical protein
MRAQDYFSDADVEFLKEGYPNQPFTDVQWEALEAAVSGGVTPACPLCILVILGIHRSGGMHSH